VTTERPDVRTLYRRFVVWEAAAVLRHDVRNKLASIRNASFYLRRRVESEATALVEKDKRVPVFFELIGKELDAADALISERIPQIGGEPPRATVAVEDALDDALQAIPIPSGVNVRRPDSANVVADPSELAIGIFCLVENAVDALTPTGGTIAISTRRDDANVVIEISDDGPGLPFEARRAMEQFVTTKPDRLGLGLAIAKRVVARMRGTLELVPGSERGTRAVIVVPAAD
jgi:signal transduction histidine kinase